ncbi:TetR/AcrR family transcriptional regulator, partial [Streptomyces albidoflavus]|uniref:TetR/AcrR family transcriptional regulator n=1 Tax=Streptomyces albidoflavus TaxID=1886 RepID=UPI00211BB4D7
MDATETRPLTPAGRRIAAAAEELFYERGITGVGVDLIAEHSGVTKRTLYNQFGSKDHLVAVYLAERDRRWRSLVQATVDARATPRDAVLAPFEAPAAPWMRGKSSGPRHPARRRVPGTAVRPLTGPQVGVV